MGCIHAFVGEAAAVRVLVKLCGQSKHVAFKRNSSVSVVKGCSELMGKKGIKGTVKIHPVCLVVCA